MQKLFDGIRSFAMALFYCGGSWVSFFQKIATFKFIKLKDEKNNRNHSPISNG